MGKRDPKTPAAASRADAIGERQLGTVLRCARDEIIAGLAHTLRVMPDTGYAAQPPAALRESTGAAFDSLVRALESGEVRELRAFAADLAAERVKQGFRLSEPLRALTALRNSMERVLRTAWADDPAAMLAGTQRVQRVVDLATLAFADAYVDATMADTAQYLQRLRELNAQLTDESTHDKLTGLYDRGYFDLALARETRRAARYHRPLSLAMADVDHFKRVNDTFGHPMGDLALQHVAGLLLGAVRATDYVCRYGGEEFAILLPETNLGQALAMAERTRRSIESRPVNLGTPVSLTICLGVAAYPDQATDGPTLVAQADTALYAAKAAGRNRVTAAEGPTLPLRNEARERRP